jgi:hypothetical protein
MENQRTERVEEKTWGNNIQQVSFLTYILDSLNDYYTHPCSLQTMRKEGRRRHIVQFDWTFTTSSRKWRITKETEWNEEN